MRIASALVIFFAVLFCNGCVVVGATVAAVGAVAAVTVKTAGKVTVATVKTTGRVATAAVSSSGEVAALSMESAAKLTKAGMVVLVEAGTGAMVELPWQDGMKLYSAAKAGGFKKSFGAAKIFREGRQLTADLRRAKAGGDDILLSPGDVVELVR